MWMIPPTLMCKQHLLGEHNEIHKHRPSFEKRHKIDGRFENVVTIEPSAMKQRHDCLARYMNHKSEFTQPDISHLPLTQQHAKVDTILSLLELSRRCPKCRQIILGGNTK